MNSEAVMTTMNVDAVALAAHGGVDAARRPRGHVSDRFRRSEIGEPRPADWDGLLEMYWEFEGTQRVRGMPPATEEAQAAWVDALLRRGPNVVARVCGRVVGHAALAPDGGAAHDLTVFVRPEWQGRGVARALVAALAALARRRGVELIRARVEPGNAGALATLRAAGFELQPADGSGEERWTLVPSGRASAWSPRLIADAARELVRGWLRAGGATDRETPSIPTLRAVAAARSAPPRGGDETRTAASYLGVFHPPGVIRITTAEEEAAMRRGASAGAAPVRARNSASRARSVA
jgi:ribosomal protein S18 acetylase RimI-like enzyme